VHQRVYCKHSEVLHTFFYQHFFYQMAKEVIFTNTFFYQMAKEVVKLLHLSVI